jgi:hypothetical protein
MPLPLPSWRPAPGATICPDCGCDSEGRELCVGCDDPRRQPKAAHTKEPAVDRYTILRCKAANERQLAACHEEQAEGYERLANECAPDLWPEPPLPDNWLTIAEMDVPGGRFFLAGARGGVR